MLFAALVMAAECHIVHALNPQASPAFRQFDEKQLGAERKAAESCAAFHEVDLRGRGQEDWSICAGEGLAAGDDGKRLGACGKRLRVALHCAPARPPEDSREVWGGEP